MIKLEKIITRHSAREMKSLLDINMDLLIHEIIDKINVKILVEDVS